MNRLAVSFRKEAIYIFFLAPAILLYFTFFILPSLQTFYYSFTNWSDVNPVDVTFVGFKNFAVLLRDEVYLKGITNTFTYAILYMVFVNVCAIPLAVALNQKLVTRSLLRSIFFLPAVFSVLVIGFLWSFLYSTSDFGLINQIVTGLGFEKINFLGNPKIALYAVVFTQVWQFVGYNMVIYLANLQTIPSDYYEAAKMDGATGLQTFRSITLPLLLPAISFCTVMTMINGLKVFDIVFALTGGGPAHATETIISLMITKGINEGFYGQGSAFGIVFMLLVLLLTTVHLRVIKYLENR
ncbi:carbohydrate ABC transporter permease [Cohnella silvisoli]|uniref:Sugar ABC transporter permease n=1 Tax=Cohnella silvisoli TaxID=2873699 RepID=A0ABV1L2L8_9BACL|nr:sugar ABC transporter permease [Cohnella silvisoli]MCD9025853.1 sugar ABC transporter permease [Cohnella silvisoli]